MDAKRDADAEAAVRRAWREAHVAPLWESPTAHKLDRRGEAAHLWSWRMLRPLITETCKIRSPAAVERRVLSLVNPASRGPEDEATTRNISAAIQILMPGEAARPHRHSMNALRFVLEGGGGATIVNGKRCAMAEGDLIITPGWTWHEHVHNGTGPLIWLDVLDVPLHLYLGTDRFEAGPPNEMPHASEDAAFAVASILPEGAVQETRHSPVFRYPHAAALAALAAAPPGEDGARRVRYTNPLTGGPVMALLDCTMVELAAERQTRAFRTTANAVCAVLEGRGTSRIGEREIAWEPRDIFTLPHGNWVSHRAAAGGARLFLTSDREVLRRLDLLEEEFAA